MRRKKDIRKKTLRHWQKQIRQKQLSKGYRMEDNCETEIRLLRKNNRSLAKALSDQKIETNHWHTETIALTGELHDLQGKLMKMPNNNTNVDSVFIETEKQIKAFFESINKDFTSALDRIVQAVDKLTKVKHLVGNVENVIQGSSSIFSRTPGSRTPLKSSGAMNSPRQRAVPPMVDGHVLQPAMVPLLKLKVDWNDKKNNHLLVQDSGLNMTTIGEQSTPENSEESVVSEEQSLENTEEEQQPDIDDEIIYDDSGPDTALEKTNTQAESGKNTPRRYSTRCRTKASSEPQTKVTNKNSPKRNTGRRSEPRNSSGSKASRSPAKASPGSAGEKKAHKLTCTEEDPLEGPSWLLDVGKRFRSRFNGRQGRIQKQKFVLDSSDDDDETLFIKPKSKQKKFPKSRFKKKADSPGVKAKRSLSQPSDSADSPTSMLARMEALEAMGGRKSKRFLKNKKLPVITLQEEFVDAPISLPEDQQPDTGIIANPEGTGSEVESTTGNEKETLCNTNVLINDSPDLLIEENNQTCQIVSNMDITQPVSHSIILKNPASTLEKNKDNLEDESTQPKKKFFKAKITELSEEVQEKQERTPFDFSMLNESVIKMPPFSSTRTTEKENLPPPPLNDSNEFMNLCNVSVVLEDVMKQPGYSKTPKELLTKKKTESPSAKSVSPCTPKKLKLVTRRTLQYTTDNSNDDTETNKPKRARKDTKREKKSISFSGIDEYAPQIDTNASDEPANKENVESVEKKLNGSFSDKSGTEEDLSECFVVIQRKPMVENFISVKSNSGTPKSTRPCSDVLSDLQQQQTSKNMTTPGQENVEVPRDTRVTPRDSSRIPVETIDGCDHAKRKGECQEDILPGITGEEEPEIKCTFQSVEKPHNVRSAQRKRSGGRESSERRSRLEDVGDLEPVRSPRETRAALKQSSNNLLDIEFLGAKTVRVKSKTKSRSLRTRKSIEYYDDVQEVEEVTTSITNAEPSEGNRKKRRAAARVSSFKEIGINRKMRRGDNNTVFISKAEMKRRNTIGRGRGRGKRSFVETGVTT